MDYHRARILGQSAYRTLVHYDRSAYTAIIVSGSVRGPGSQAVNNFFSNHNSKHFVWIYMKLGRIKDNVPFTDCIDFG